MKREEISKAVSNISLRYVQEAEVYTRGRRNFMKRHLVKAAMAAVLVLCLAAGGISLFRPSVSVVIQVCAVGTDQEITAAGVVLHTGTVRDSGEQQGHPLMFYLSGNGIESVRFSCRNQQICFTDWTEKRDEYGMAQNFTVPYGEEESDYYYLTIDWIPNATIQALHDGNTISTLPAGLREDLIVMEVAFADGTKAVKAITVSLLEDGTFFARFDDYQIGEGDTFVNRPDAPALCETSQRKESDMASSAHSDRAEEKDGTLAQEADPAAREAAMAYYKGTVFQVVFMEVKSSTEEDVVFTVCVSKGGVIQEPDRSIVLHLEDGEWSVTNEGY